MKPDETLTVVALGGNAISPPHAEGNIGEQFAASRHTASRLADLVQAGYRLVITHGNGPQVGNVLRRVELAAHEVYPLPLETCVADTQAGMGYMIAQCLNNELNKRGLEPRASTLITNVEVALADPAFAKPSKPIGPVHTRQRAAELTRDYRWILSEVRPGEFRRVVPSPMPKHIVEGPLIRRLAQEGELLIVCGGGGIPVVRDVTGAHRGIEAVIDKDYTSALLAQVVGARLLLIATNVERVALHFGQANEQPLDRITSSQAADYCSTGHFAAGSMQPKVEGAIQFLSEAPPESRTLICDLNRITDALAGRSGTWIVPG